MKCPAGTGARVLYKPPEWLVVHVIGQFGIDPRKHHR